MYTETIQHYVYHGYIKNSGFFELIPYSASAAVRSSMVNTVLVLSCRKVDSVNVSYKLE
jgi:hypothetical protein